MDRDTDHIQLRNVVVVSAADGVGTLVATILNDARPDSPSGALTKLSVRGGNVCLAPSPLRLPAGGVVTIGVGTTLDRHPATVALRGDPVKAGYLVKITFTFARAAPVTIPTLVVDHAGAYADVPIPE